MTGVILNPLDCVILSLSKDGTEGKVRFFSNDSLLIQSLVTHEYLLLNT